MFERDIEDVELFDVLKAEDALLANLTATLIRELNEGGLGGRLYCEALKNQACIHILRNYADVSLREPRVRGGLSPLQKRLAQQFVEENIDRNISLAEIAPGRRSSACFISRGSSTQNLAVLHTPT